MFENPLISGQANQHETDHCYVNHAFSSSCVSFVVAIESTTTTQPAEGSLDHPAAGQHSKSVLVGSFDNLHGATPQLSGPIDQNASVASIGPNVFEGAPRFLPIEYRQQLPSGVPVLNIGRQHQNPQHQAQRVHEHVPLAPIDLLACVVSPLLAALGTFDALAVNDPGGGLPLTSFHLPQVFPKVRMNPFPQSGVFPKSQVMIDRAPRSEVLRQVAPLAGRAHEVEHRVEQFPIAVLAGASSLLGSGKTIVDELPFGVRQVSCVSHPQCTAGMYLQCTDNYALSSKRSQFSNTL